MKLEKKKKLGADLEVSLPEKLIIHFVFILVSIVMLYPVLLVIGVSFTDQDVLVREGYKLIPSKWSIEGYKFAFTSGAIGRAYLVTIAASAIGTFLSVMIQMLYAYPLSQKRFKHRMFFTFFAYIVTLFGGGLVPWYMVCTKLLHLNDTFLALFVPSLWSFWNVVILRTFITSTVPNEMLEAARIDGCSETRIFWTMIIPLSKAGMATIGLFSLLGLWNNYYNAMMLINDEKYYPLQYYLQRIFLNIQELAKNSTSSASSAIAKQIPRETARFAMCVLTMGPILVVYPFFQKYFVKGMVVGSVKG